MRKTAGSTRRTAWLVTLLVGALLLAPAAWATGEEIREKADDESSDAKKEQKAGETPAAETKDTTDKAECKPVHPTFNTVEEIRAHRGAAAELWTRLAEPETVVTWREIAPPAESR